MPDAHARDLDEEVLALASDYLGLNGSNAEVAREAIERFAELERQRRALEEVRISEIDDEAAADLTDAIADGLDDAVSVDISNPEVAAEAIVTQLRASPLAVHATVAEDQMARSVYEGGKCLIRELAERGVIDMESERF